jgi:hypothetical protein
MLLFSYAEIFIPHLYINLFSLRAGIYNSSSESDITWSSAKMSVFKNVDFTTSNQNVK